MHHLPRDLERLAQLPALQQDLDALRGSANAMLRFDPETETFQIFGNREPNANVRQILGRKGEVWTPESGLDRIVVYRFQ